jgi:hypothetical protein
MPRRASARPLSGAVLSLGLVLTLAACSGTDPSAVSSAPLVAPPTAAPSATATAAPSAATASSETATGPRSYATAELGPDFDLPMTIDLPAGWNPLPPPNYGPSSSLGFVHGDLQGDDSTWWGFGLELVDGASVADPSVMQTPATTADAKLAWPASYLDYLAALPGVDIDDPASQITVGGVTGRSITVKTPPMHPTIFLAGDYTWLGGGKSGIDPALERRVIELTVHGKRLLIEYVDVPSAFPAHASQVDAVIQSIVFPD